MENQETLFWTCGEPQMGERFDLSTTFCNESSINEATDPTTGKDEITESEDRNDELVTRVDLLRHVLSWLYDTPNFRFKYPPSDDKAILDNVLSAFRELYAAEPVHTIEIKRECLKRAYWEKCKPTEISFNSVEMALMLYALKLMQSARFKKIMKAIGADIDEDEMAWYNGWIFASHYVLNGSDKVDYFMHNRKNTPLEVDDDVNEPMFETERIYEVIDKNENPQGMLDLLSFPGLFDDE